MVKEKVRQNTSKSIWSWLPPLLLALVIAVFYHDAIDNQTALDDTMVLTKNTFVQSGASGIPDILKHDSFYGATKKPATMLGWRYRPLSLVCFAIIHQFFGNDWSVYHVFNLLLYFACAYTVYRFLLRWWFEKTPILALSGALLFIILPVHVEVVANIKSADELLACWLSLLFLDRLLVWDSTRSRSALMAAGVFLLLALLSKESGVLLVGISALLLHVRSEKTVMNSLKSIMPFLVITVLFVLVRLLISSVPDGRIDLTNDPYVFASLHEKIATVSVVLLEYLRLILLPENLIFDYGYNHIPYTTFSNPKALVSIIVHVFLLAWCVYGVFKRKAVGFFLLAYLSGILLLSNLVLNVGPMMADRFAFFPSFFLIAAILLLIRDITHRWFPGKESVIVVILSVVAMPFAYVKSNARVLEWKNSLTLYRADLLKAPDSFRVVAFNAMEEIAIAENLSDSIAKQDKFRFAIGLMEKAYSIYPDYKNMYKEWGFAYYSLGNIDSAEWAWNRLKELFPSIQYNALNEELILNARFQEQMKIYNSSYEKKDYAFLASVLKKALNYKPAEAETWVILGKVHFLKGARDSANYAWREALRLDTANAEAKSLLLMK